MSISWYCACGKSLKAPDGSEGKRARCPACATINQVPHPEPEPVIAQGDDPFDLYALAETPAPAVTPPAYRPPPREEDEEGDSNTLDYERLPLSEGGGRTWRDFTYLVLLLALLPLVVSSFSRDKGTIFDRLDQSLKHHPEVEDKFAELAQSNKAEMDDLIGVFPGHRLDGALLPRDTAMHWAFAAMSAAGFLTLLMFLFKRGTAQPKSLLLTGLFTGTVGIVLLLAFQFMANIAAAVGFRIPHGKAGLIFLIVKLIGYSYRAAEDPTNGFFLSFIGFTFGVGLCEELCKAIPLMNLVRNFQEKATWRMACLWGLASGVGFGVAEGVMYSGRYYNGILGGDIYLVRFLSCVALHAVWSASTAIMLYMNRHRIASAEGAWGTIGYTLLYTAVPMVLHGLYDTLLKKDDHLIALAVALASFVYLAGLIEWRTLKGEGEPTARPRYELPGRHAVR